MEEKSQNIPEQDNFEKRVLETSKKSGKGLKIACTLLSIAVLALGGYLTYDKFFLAKQEDQSQAATKKEAETEEKQEAQKVKHTSGFAVDTSAGTFFITKKGDAYFWPTDFSNPTYADTYEKNYDLNFTNSEGLGEKEEYTIPKTDVELWTPVGDDNQQIKFSGYKLKLKNIVSCQEVKVGNAANTFHIIFIDQDGIANLVDITPGDKSLGSKASFRMKQFKKSKNVTASIQTYGGDGYSAILLSADGANYIIDESDWPNYKEQ